MHHNTNNQPPLQNKKPVPSVVLPDGRLAEMLYSGEAGITSFAVWDGAQVGIAHELAVPGSATLVPYRADNPLFTNRVVLLPSKAEPYESTAALVAEITKYVHRYADLTPAFEALAVQYVLFTWVFDRFRELPYLRLHGEYGSGKTRFLQVVGSICRTPIFAGGASTISPLFHLLDRFRGTLILDEADFRMSDERAQLVKILNNGNMRGFPVLRSETINGKEYRPVAYQVYGPKLVAMRGEFDDRALESRFISERSDGRALRTDIPLNLPDEQAGEALALRNQLLMYRFRRYTEAGSWFDPVDRALEPRLNQVFSPLFSNIEDGHVREALRAYAWTKNRGIADERAISVEAELLAVIRYLAEHGPSPAIGISDIADLHARAFARLHAAPLSPRAVGNIVRKRLGVATKKSNGMRVIAQTERVKFAALFDRYDVAPEDAEQVGAVDMARPELTIEPITAPGHGDFGDIGDFVRRPLGGAA